MSGAAGGAVLAIDPNSVGPGLLGFLVVAGIAAATYFLIRSMNKRVKKIDFEEKPAGDGKRDAGKGPGADARDAAG